MPLLLKALVCARQDEGLARVLQFVQESPDDFNLDDCQVPALKSLIPWCKKRLGSVHPRLASWLNSVRQRLEAATAKAPTLSADLARPATVNCTCQLCARLNAFLADPSNAIVRIPASEEMRHHLTTQIGRFKCDIKAALERQGRPYSLLLTKTRGSFDRDVKRYEENLRLLSVLPTST